MKRLKGRLPGLAAAFMSAAGVEAGELPTHKAGPVEYVRLCDAFGAGFFSIPGTGACLKIGGLALAEFRGYNPTYSINGSLFYGNGASPLHTEATGPLAAGFGYIPSPGQYHNQRSRDAYVFNALGRVELDARAQSGWGAARTFVRIDSLHASGSNIASGSLMSGGIINTTAGTATQRETTIVSRAFIQFAGLTAGRAQSMFDFYADAYNFAPLRGSNATVGLLAYTATFDSGVSATISIEDQASRRAAIGGTFAGATLNASGTAITPISLNGVSATSFQASPAGARTPEIVGNLRLNQPWGDVQLSAAAHQVDASLFASDALATAPTAYAFPVLTSNSYGFAVQGGAHLNLDTLSPGDNLWLQAGYERGAFGYIAGYNLAFVYDAVNANRFSGSGFGAMDYGNGWNPQTGSDCVFTSHGPSLVSGGSCQQQWGWDLTGAYKHYWLPALASAFHGSYLQVDFPRNALDGFGGGVGVSNLKEARFGANLVWTPVEGFDIGAEFMYVHLSETRPVGLASNAALNAVGLPSFQGAISQYIGHIRVQRAF